MKVDSSKAGFESRGALASAAANECVEVRCPAPGPTTIDDSFTHEGGRVEETAEVTKGGKR